MFAGYSEQTIITTLIFAAAMGAAGAYIMHRYAFALGFVDLPNDRSSHKNPTPRSGGVGILFATALLAPFLGVEYTAWVFACVISLVSLADDRFGLSAKHRFIAQFICAASFTALTLKSEGQGLYGYIALFCFWAIYVCATANFFNFMDGINGIAGATGALAFASLGAYAHFKGMGKGEILFDYCVCAACLGFLPFNFPKAKVFMGDVGSVFLGFLFATQSLRYATGTEEFFAIVGFLFMFYADTLTTLLIRCRDGEKLSQAHRRHLYQVFANEFGKPHYVVTTGYAVVQAAVSASLIFGATVCNISSIIIVAAWSALYLSASFLIRKRAAMRI